MRSSLKESDIELQAENLNDFVRSHKGTSCQFFKRKGLRRDEKMRILEASAKMAMEGSA